MTAGAALAILYSSSFSPAAFVKRRGKDATLGRCLFVTETMLMTSFCFRSDHGIYSKCKLETRLGWPLGHRNRHGIPILKQVTDKQLPQSEGLSAKRQRHGAETEEAPKAFEEAELIGAATGLGLRRAAVR